MTAGGYLFLNLPPPLDLFGLDIAGAWSSYWYSGFIYEANMGERLNGFRPSDRSTAGAKSLDRVNLQTQEFTIP